MSTPIFPSSPRLIQLDPATFIPALLKQDLIVFRVRQGLEQLGFLADDFYTELPDLVMQLMDFPKEELDRVYGLYFDFQDRLDLTMLRIRRYLEVVALEAYCLLAKEKCREARI